VDQNTFLPALLSTAVPIPGAIIFPNNRIARTKAEKEGKCNPKGIRQG